MFRNRSILLAAALFCGLSGFAEEINSVKFQQSGDYKFGEDILDFNIQSKKGSKYDERVVNGDIKRLHETGYFADVAVETVKSANGKIDLIFKIAPKVTVKRIDIKGNKLYSKEKLMEKISLVVGAPLNDKKLTESREALYQYYVNSGHNDAIVRWQTKRAGNQVIVEFLVTENLKLRVNDIDFDGLTVFKPRELRGAIANQYSWLGWIPFLDFGLLNKEELQNDLVRLREKYWEKGYLDFRVKETLLSEKPGDPTLVNIKFVIDEGKPYKVGRVRILGTERFPVKDLTGKLAMKTGDVYRASAERASIDGIESKYAPLGYADFYTRPERMPDFRTHVVDIDLHVQEGKPYKINNILISGNKWTKDHVIRRELPIMPGDPVDKNLVKTSQQRLMGMGYFNKVSAVTVNAAEPEKKDVDIQVDEKNFVNAKIGAGFSDTDSLAGMVELSHSNMDILDPKNYFMGGGQRMRIIGMYGIERYNFEADFTEPWLFGIPLRWDLSGYLRNVIYEDWKEQRLGFTTSLTKRVFDDFTTLSGGYTFEHVRVYDMDSDLSNKFQDEEGGSYVGRVHLSIDRDTRDSATDPRSGYNVNLYSAVTSRIFGASNDYYRFELKGINYYSFLDNFFTLSAGAKVGTIGTIGDPTKDPPIYERYFLGGGDSVRGFYYRTIGPEDGNDDVYGGDFMYLATFELSHPIYDFIRGAAFCDIGNATSSRFGPFTYPNIGVGYGLRIKLPVINAPIKLDLAYPVLNNQDGVRSKFRFHFNMGFTLF